MKTAIREAGERQAAALEAARRLEEKRRAEAEARMHAAKRSIDLLNEGLVTLAALLVENAPPETKYGRRAQRDAADPTDVFYLPEHCPYVHWWTLKQKGWYLTTSSRWDGAMRLLGESDLRVAILANGKLSRTLLLDTPEARAELTREIIDCAARYHLEWPADGPNLADLLEAEDRQ